MSDTQTRLDAIREGAAWLAMGVTEDDPTRAYETVVEGAAALADELERVTAALRERFVGKTGGCLLCDDYWETPEGLACACGMLVLAGGARAGVLRGCCLSREGE
jgi:hypothetical protein